MEIIINIGASKDSLGAYHDSMPIFGAGDTMAEVKQSILDSIEINKELGNIPNEDYQIKYKFDTESLLQYYKGILTNPALEKLTGINQKQMHHYATGLKKPREAQRKKIQKGLHAFAHELLAIEL